MKKQIFLFAITICVIGCTKNADFTSQDFNRRITDLNSHRGKYKSSYDWKTDSAFKWMETNAIKWEVLLHLTPEGKVVLRVTNLQSCPAIIYIHDYAPSGFNKMYQPNLPDTVHIIVTDPDGYDLVGVSPGTDCSGDADKDIFSFQYNINDLQPYEAKRKYPF